MALFCTRSYHSMLAINISTGFRIFMNRHLAPFCNCYSDSKALLNGRKIKLFLRLYCYGQIHLSRKYQTQSSCLIVIKYRFRQQIFVLGRCWFELVRNLNDISLTRMFWCYSRAVNYSCLLKNAHYLYLWKLCLFIEMLLMKCTVSPQTCVYRLMWYQSPCRIE